MGNCAGATSAQLQGVTPGPPTARQKPKSVSSFGLRDANALSAAPKLATASATDALAVPAACGAEIVAPLEPTFALTTDGLRASALASAAHLPPGAAAPPTLPDELRLPRDDDNAARAAVRAFAAEVAGTHGPPKPVEGAEHRATNLRELGILVEFVKRHSGSWVGRRCVDGKWLDVRGLESEDVNLYDVNDNLLKPLGSTFGAAYSELFAQGKQREPKVFVSHAWSHPLLQTVKALVQHAEDREYGEDEPIWICAFAIRQHAVELGAIEVSPFYKALKATAMTLIIVAAEGEGVLDRSWCALEAYLAMVEGGAGYLTDIYTHHKGKVQRLTDGLIAADDTNPHDKARRDQDFPFAIVERALCFKLEATKAAVQRDYDNIMQHVQMQEGGGELLDATVRACYFVAGLAAAVEAENGTAMVAAGMAALERSVLPRLVLTSNIGDDHARTLMRSLPSSVVELRLPGVQIGDNGAEILAAFLASSKALSILDLSSNNLDYVAATTLAKALEVNASLTVLYLGLNRIADAGAIGLGKALEVNASLTVLSLRANKIADAGAVALGKALEVNASLTELYLFDNQIADAGAIGLAEGLKVNASLTQLQLYGNQIGDTGALGLGKALEVNASLTSMNLLRNEFGIEAAAELVQAAKSKGDQLKSLCGIELGAKLEGFSGKGLGDSDAILLSYDVEVNASLTTLYLYRNQIADAGAVALGKALEVNASLTNLELGWNQIADAGAIGLAKALEFNASLTKLDLEYNKIGDAGKRAVRAAWKGPSAGLEM